MPQNRIALFLLMLVMMIGSFVAFMTLTKKPEVNPFSKKEVTHTGTPAIGGAFTLTNQSGKTVSDADFRGKYMLVYFGYTFCPDVCPADLLTISSAMQALGEDADKIAPVFISVDPERDTVEQLHTYMQNFDPRITALTGSREDIAKVATEYKVYYQKVENQGLADYLIDHTAITYLMDKDGKFLTHFSHATSTDAMVKKIQEVVK